MSNNAIVELSTLRQIVEGPTFVKQLSSAIPKSLGLKPEQLARQALTLCQTNPELLECSQFSILAGIVQSAQLGLQLSGPLGHAYLVPRFDKRTGRKEASFQVGWKGLVALAWRSGLVQAFTVRTVRENDTFGFAYGTNPRLEHIPAHGDRGAATHYYAAVFFKGGGFDFEVMSHEETEAHRKKYGGKGPAWSNSDEQMRQKIPVRQLCRRLSMCPEAQGQTMREEYAEAGVPVHLEAEVLDVVQAIGVASQSDVIEGEVVNGSE